MFLTLYLIDNMFWCVGNEIGSFERYVTKKQRFGFRCKIPFFQSLSTKNKFWFVGNEIKLLWGLNHKKRAFLLFCCQNTLLSALLQQHAVKLGCFRCCCTRKMFFAGLEWVTLIFSWFYSKQRSRLFSAKLRCFQHYICENSLSFFSVPKLRV